MPRKPNKTPEKVCRIAAGLFAARGYHATTMDDVAAGVGLNKGTLYYYFPGKADVLFSICDDIVESFIGVLDAVPDDAAPPEVIATLLRSQLEMLVERPNEVVVFLHELRFLKQWLSAAQYNEIRSKEVRFGNAVVAVIQTGIDNGDFDPIDPLIASHNIMGMVAWASTWYRPKGGIDIKDVAEETVRLTLAGFGARASRLAR